MSCISCTKAQPLPSCISDLTIGTLTADTDYYVYFKKLSNNRLQRLDVTTDGAGLAVVDLSTFTEYLTSGSTFEVWLTTTDADNIYDRAAITIGAETAIECLLLTFSRVQSKTYTAQTVTL